MRSVSPSRSPTTRRSHSATPRWPLLGHEYCAAVDVEARLVCGPSCTRDAPRSGSGSHVHAVVSHIAGDSAPLIQHLEAYPRDALLLSVAVPTIAFAGVTTVPAGLLGDRRAGRVERTAIGLVVHRPAGLHPAGAAPVGRGDATVVRVDWRWSPPPVTPCTPEPTCTTRRATTGPACDWLDGWIHGDGRGVGQPGALLLARGSARAVDGRLRGGPQPLHRSSSPRRRSSAVAPWSTRARCCGAGRSPRMRATYPAVDTVIDDVRPAPARRTADAVHGDALGRHLVRDGRVRPARRSWRRGLAGIADPAYARGRRRRSAAALEALVDGGPRDGGRPARTSSLGSIWRLGGSDAQREVVEDTLIAALLAPGRLRPTPGRCIDRRLGAGAVLPSRDPRLRSSTAAAPTPRGAGSVRPG